MKLTVLKDYGALCDAAAGLMLDRLADDRVRVLGFATGDTPLGLYRRLVDAHRKGQVSFRGRRSFNLDEYLGLAHDHPCSYRAYMRENLFRHVDFEPGETFLPDPANDPDEEAGLYERRIAESGGIDFQIAGVGVNGHIGFNEPGSPRESRTRVVRLTDATLALNRRFFPDPSQQPDHAITMGVATILECRELMVLASGEAKAEAVRAMSRGPVSEQCPASFLREHPGVTVLLDEAAAPLL